MAKNKAVKNTPVNIEDVKPHERGGLRPFLFHIAGAQVTILAKDQRDAVIRFKEMTEDTVVFITDAEMERRRQAEVDRVLNAALDVIDDANERIEEVA